MEGMSQAAREIPVESLSQVAPEVPTESGMQEEPALAENRRGDGS